MERLEKLKLNSIENPGKKKKGCTDCKKKKEVLTKLEPVVEEYMFIPTQEEIKLAYAELTSLLGVKDDKKEFINKVYQFLFNEDFDWGCRSCVNNQARRFRIYLYGK
jgi:predicted dithiol-disulfide oxidoreductase (DUF899 family)